MYFESVWEGYLNLSGGMKSRKPQQACSYIGECRRKSKWSSKWGETGRLPSRNARMGVDQGFLEHNTCKGAEKVRLWLQGGEPEMSPRGSSEPGHRSMVMFWTFSNLERTRSDQPEEATAVNNWRGTTSLTGWQKEMACRTRFTFST